MRGAAAFPRDRPEMRSKGPWDAYAGSGSLREALGVEQLPAVVPEAQKEELPEADQTVRHSLLRGRGKMLALHGGDFLALPSSGSSLLILPDRGTLVPGLRGVLLRIAEAPMAWAACQEGGDP